MGPRRRVLVEVRIAAPVGRVWRALCEPAEVERWAGVAALDVPAGYPTAGQRARWRTRLGPWPVTLHDQVRAVEPPTHLAARIIVGIARIEESYRLLADGEGTTLLSDNAVTARLPGLGRLAERQVRRDVVAGLAELRSFCESQPR